MRILYVSIKYDYGKPEQGYSFEHYNFYESLRHMGHTILYFDFMSLMQQYGSQWMNHRLVEVVQAEKPDFMFTCLYRDQIDQNVLRYISNRTNTVTFNWFCDDHWRFDNFSCFWAPCFNWVVTTAQSALPKYAAIGYGNVIKSQWACNHFSYKKLDVPIKYDVTFIGQPHGDRRQVIQRLKQAGLKVQVWGRGWENGRISQEDMIEVFNASRINLNLSNSSAPQLPSSANQSPTQQYHQQIKGRNFEVPGCGGFLLTSTADNLEDYYTPGKEIVCFNDTEDLISKIRYYLEHEDERQAIAQAGYERTLKEHTYAQRFNHIFQQIGLPQGVTAEEKFEIGQTIEIVAHKN